MTGKYEPHTEEVKAIIARLKTLTIWDAEVLSEAHEDMPPAHRNSAKCFAERAVSQSVHNDNWQAAKRDVMSYAYDEAREEAWYLVRYGVVDVALDAILAIFARDSITPEQYALLYAPWSSVMGAGGGLMSYVVRGDAPTSVQARRVPYGAS